jgi:hypothetical protein
MNGNRAPVFVIVFAAVYTVVYLIAVQKNYALFTYHPALEQFGLLVEKPKEGPAMYWYGWLTTSALGALAIAAFISWLPVVSAKRLWHGCAWTVPLLVMVVFVFMLRRYFVR